ncbi:sulfite exporter TauE/SafE family protein [Breoghania sp. L-A4]|uniref:sulfite exporter TauE/SafE family protein n=1 Tax=Breoghania sp. L-A4 TaxID=2304600 RepID=UPI000E35864C|nr:sulfite exporter TauE/SafE family protein [Breoghania sp. L-A4]AXS41672.1 sulfite exporter TauE/SafE family protein [Breoghania sp. L-A4]
MMDFLVLPEGVAVWAAYVMILASLATSFITAAFGIGGGMVMIAVLAVLLPPVALIPVHGAVQFGSNAGRTALMLGHVDRSTLLPFTLGSLLGVALGGLLFVQFPPWAVQLGLALFIMWSVFGRFPRISGRHLFAGGIFSSFLTMLFGATGSFIAAMVKTMRLDPLDHVATHSALMTLQHLLKVIAFGLLGFAFSAYLPLVLAMIVSGFVGTYLGKQILVRMGAAYFKPILNAILLLAAARLLWSAAEALMRSPGTGG